MRREHEAGPRDLTVSDVEILSNAFTQNGIVNYQDFCQYMESAEHTQTAMSSSPNNTSQERNSTAMAIKPNDKARVVRSTDRVEVSISRIDTKGLPNVEKGFGMVDKNDVYVKLKLGSDGKELQTETQNNAGSAASFDYEKKDKHLANTMKWETTVGELSTSTLSWSVWDWNDPNVKDKRDDVCIGRCAAVALALTKVVEGKTEMSETIELKDKSFDEDKDKKKPKGTVTIVLNVKVLEAKATATAATPNQLNDGKGKVGAAPAVAPVVTPAPTVVTGPVSVDTRPKTPVVSTVSRTDRIEVSIKRIDAKGLPNVEKAAGFLGIKSLGMVDKNDVYVKLKLGSNGKELKTETQNNAGSAASFDYEKKDKHLADTMKWETTVGELSTSTLSWSVWDWNDPNVKDKRDDVCIGRCAAVALALTKVVEGKTEMSETIELKDKSFDEDKDKKKPKGTVTIVLNVKVLEAKATATAAAPNQLNDDKGKVGVAPALLTNTGAIKQPIDKAAAAAASVTPIRDASKITASTLQDKKSLVHDAKAGGGGAVGSGVKGVGSSNDVPPKEQIIQPPVQVKVEDIFTAEDTLRTNLQEDQDGTTAADLMAKLQTMDMKRLGYIKREQFNFVLSQIPTIKLSQLEMRACMDYFDHIGCMDYFDHIGDGSQIDYHAFTAFCAYRTPTMIPAWMLLQTIPFGPTAISTMKYVIYLLTVYTL